MARLQSASIRLVQKMNRQNKNGENPIYVVVCFKGRKEKACGISCLPRYWDSRRELIKVGCANAPVLNKMLSDIKQRVIDKKNFYELNGRVYTPSMLLEESVNDLDGRRNTFVSLMELLYEERRLKWKSVLKYRYTYSKICEYLRRDDFIIDELNIGFVKDFVRWLDGRVNDNTKRNILGNIAAVWNYGIQRGICDSKDYPFREYRFTQKFPFSGRTYFIDPINMVKLKEYFLDLVCERRGGMWSYREGALDRLRKRSSKEFGILYFLAMMKFNGSAPIDVATLKVSDCRPMQINGERYWAVDFPRQKSGVGVHCRLKRDMFVIILLEHFLGYSSGGYVYPIVSEGAKSEKQIIGCCNKAGESAIKWVRKAFEEINQKTIENNVRNGLEEPLVEVEKVVLYTARHSVANAYLMQPGASIHGLASILARSANTISQYVHQIQGDREIADEVSKLPI